MTGSSPLLSSSSRPNSFLSLESDMDNSQVSLFLILILHKLLVNQSKTQSMCILNNKLDFMTIFV